VNVHAFSYAKRLAGHQSKAGQRDGRGRPVPQRLVLSGAV